MATLGMARGQDSALLLLLCLWLLQGLCLSTGMFQLKDRAKLFPSLCCAPGSVPHSGIFPQNTLFSRLSVPSCFPPFFFPSPFLWIPLGEFPAIVLMFSPVNLVTRATKPSPQPPPATVPC